jgi:hypothetical protein
MISQPIPLNRKKRKANLDIFLSVLHLIFDFNRQTIADLLILFNLQSLFLKKVGVDL